MKVRMERDEEICEEPYLAVRFYFESDGEVISKIDHEVVINDGNLSEDERNLKIVQWIVLELKDDYVEDLLFEARQLIELNLADEKLAARKES